MLFRSLVSNQLTDARYVMFSIRADAPIEDAFAVFDIMCGGGRRMLSRLVSPVELGRGTSRSAILDLPQQTVFLRTDGKIHVHEWIIDSGFRMLIADKSATREFLKARQARIQFTDAEGHARVAVFSPGLKTKLPDDIRNPGRTEGPAGGSGNYYWRKSRARHRRNTAASMKCSPTR